MSKCDLYRGFRYPAAIISHVVWLYFRGMVQKPRVLVNTGRAGTLPEMPWHEGSDNAL